MFNNIIEETCIYKRNKKAKRQKADVTTTQSCTSNGNIKKMLREESPSYRLEKVGPTTLKTSELLALIIGGSTQSSSAIKSAEDLLMKFNGNLSKLAGATLHELSAGIDGIGPTKAAQLMASFELGKRIAGFIESEKPSINTPNDVAQILIPTMRYLKQETFKVLMLDTKNRLLRIETISTGILDAALVHPREVFFSAIQNLASSIILAHNHPSGNCIPSSQDLEITKNLIEAGKILNIEVIDHIIIGDGKFISLKEKKII